MEDSVGAVVEVTQDPTIKALIARALSGQLPRPRSLKYWEPDTITVNHIQMAFDSALGWTGNEIAAKYEVSAARVSVILNHPDIQTILAAIAGTLGDRITDPIERFKATAGEAATEIISTMRTTKNEGLRRKCALDVLEMAGYGAPKIIKAEHAFVVPEAVAARLSNSLDKAREVASVDYTQFTQKPKQLGEGSVDLFEPVERPEPAEQCVGQPPANDSPSQQKVA